MSFCENIWISLNEINPGSKAYICMNSTPSYSQLYMPSISRVDEPSLYIQGVNYKFESTPNMITFGEFVISVILY